MIAGSCDLAARSWSRRLRRGMLVINIRRRLRVLRRRSRRLKTSTHEVKIKEFSEAMKIAEAGVEFC